MTTAKDKLAALKAQFGSQKEGGAQGGTQFVNNYYPFWNMKTGQRAVLRFLPDKDESNIRGFLVEKTTHNLFINGQKKTVPCLSMYGEDCPVCKISQDYYKSKDEVNGKKYWRKKQYLAQALIVEDPLPANPETGETHQGKVRAIALGYQIYNIIKEAFASEDDPLEGIPYDFEDGYDFVIKRTDQGEYPSYTTGTKFLSKQRALSEEELAVVQEGMVELKTLLPKNPGFDKVQAQLSADLNGEDYVDDSKPAPRAAAPKPAPAQDDDDVPFTPSPKPAAKAAAPKAAPVAESAGDEDVDEMLAQIRARRASKA